MQLPAFTLDYPARLRLFNMADKKNKISIIKALRDCFRDKDGATSLGLYAAKVAVEECGSHDGSSLFQEKAPNLLSDLFGVTHAPDDQNVLFFRAVKALENGETWKAIGFRSLRAAVETIARNFD